MRPRLRLCSEECVRLRTVCGTQSFSAAHSLFLRLTVSTTDSFYSWRESAAESQCERIGPRLRAANCRPANLAAELAACVRRTLPVLVCRARRSIKYCAAKSNYDFYLSRLLARLQQAFGAHFARPQSGHKAVARRGRQTAHTGASSSLAEP